MKYQCMFDTRNAFIIENEVDWKRRKSKEAIYSIVGVNPWAKCHFSGKLFFRHSFRVFLVAPILKTCPRLKGTRPSMKRGRFLSERRFTSKWRRIEKKIAASPRIRYSNIIDTR